MFPLAQSPQNPRNSSDRDAPQQSASPTHAAANWLSDPNVFPLAVWLQNPDNAEKYQQAGINLFVALYRGPTAEQLAKLQRHGMHAVVSQSQRALQFKDSPVIVAWMHNDEPDNAQRQRDRGGWGPPVAPEKIVEDYQGMKAADPGRPVLLNLGQGVAWDGWHGRGVRSNHPEDYPQYIRGCDIASFDIYPACHEHQDVAGKIWLVAHGVSRLREWSGGQKRVWNCVETTHINNPNARATPQQVRAEVWMSIIHGSTGIIYFCHEFKPRFIEAGLLAHEDVLAEVTKVNHQIQQLAPVLNSPAIEQGVQVTSSNVGVPVDAMVKHHGGSIYVFAAAMRDGASTGTFKPAGVPPSGQVEVLGESRTLQLSDGAFKDDFASWDMHLYRLQAK
ncbi:MAG: hypothetical protein HY000_35540 [Planctomycetes bacterium]|nr:hypothetical protein [Planctomycetota bacterium]